MSNVDITILSRTFNIACPEEKHDTLRSAAKMLDNELHNLRGSMASGVEFEKLAVTAALNFCARYERLVHEFEAQMTSIMEMNNELAAQLAPIAKERVSNSGTSAESASESLSSEEPIAPSDLYSDALSDASSTPNDEPLRGFDAGDDEDQELGHSNGNLNS